MEYQKSLIYMTSAPESSESMYSLIYLEANGLLLTLNGIRCYLDGHYLLCLSQDDRLNVNSGYCEAQTLHFLPYFYNVNLNHNVIGLNIYEEMRDLYGYPDFHLFRSRDDRFFGIVRLNFEEYEMAKLCFQRAKRHIDDHQSDKMWSCRTRSDMISILRIAEGAYLGEQSEKGNEILRYIRDNIGKDITLPALCKQFNTNRTTLTELVKELTGLSPMQYVLDERLSQSRPDLLFTSVPISEIAEKYGFDDPNYYIRAFKKRFGITPLKYRVKGLEERIKNENIYHEKERKVMRPEEFESYVRKGLGRAITLLKEESDKKPYRKILIDMLTDENLLHRFLGEYEKELIDCFDDRDDIAHEIAESSLAIMESGEISLINIGLLVLLGYRDAVIELAEQRYLKSYAELLEFTKRGDSDEKYPPCSEEYFRSASALARCKVDSTRMKQILTDMADLYRYSECPVVPEYQNPIFTIMDGYGKDALYPLIDEVIAEHPYGSKFGRHSPRGQLYRIPPKPLKDVTAEDILACEGFNEDYGYLHASFMNADESVVRAVAERILNETDRKRQLHWLSFFTTAISPSTVPPAFPLDPTPLVEIAEQLYQDSNPAVSDDTARYLNALMFTRHPSVKSLAKRMLENNECPRRFRNYALHMFYGANYTCEDREDFSALLLSESSPDRDALFRIFGYLIGQKTPDIPIDLIPYVFEAFSGPWIRRDFIEALIKGDALSDEIKAECAFDSAKITRRLIAEL